MPTLRPSRVHLHDWVAAGLLTPEQAERIMAYEAERAVSDPAPSVPPPPPSSAAAPPAPGSRRPSGVAGAEAIGYVGAALVVSALGRMLSELWRELTTTGRLSLAGLVAVLALAAATGLHRIQRPALQRLTSVLFSVGVLAVAWFAGLVADEVIGARGAVISVTASAAAAALAVPLYVWRPRGLPQATALAAVLATVLSLLALPALTPDVYWFGLLAWAVGVAWLLAGLGRWALPAGLAGVLGGVVALLGVQVATFDGERLAMLLLGVATAGALVGLAVWADTLHHLVVGAVGLFVLVPQVVFELFGDALGAPAALLVVGLLLVLLAVGLGRAGREVRRDGAGADHGDDADADRRDRDEPGGEPR